jgi:CHASE2 domain-containing sensor protein
MSNKKDQPFNTRTYRGKLERELIIGGIIVGVIVGGGLIALIWGLPAFFTALACLLGFFVMVGIVWGFLKLIEIVSRD